MAADTEVTILSDAEMREIRGGMIVSNIVRPTFDAQNNFTAENDTFRVQFDFDHDASNFTSPVLIQLYSGNTKTGWQSVQTSPSTPGFRSGQFNSRMQSHPLGQVYQDFHPRILDVANGVSLKAGEYGQPNNQFKQRYIRYNSGLHVYKVWFHMIKEPNVGSTPGPSSSISYFDAVSLVDNPKAVYAIGQYTDSADAYPNNSCSIPNRFNFRFHALDTLNVSYAGMAGTVTPIDYSTWHNRFTTLAATLDPNYYHVFIADQTTANWGEWFNNHAVLGMNSSLTWLAGTLDHEFGHSNGHQHVDDSAWFGGNYIWNSQYNNCNLPADTRNVMCVSRNGPAPLGHGATWGPLQCSDLSNANVTDFN
ncbi:MAG: hypothetical protein KA343_11995 [Nitrosomonas sp.]|nr:hypothetical protein [Nitrosomonas sp.]